MKLDIPPANSERLPERIAPAQGSKGELLIAFNASLALVALRTQLLRTDAWPAAKVDMMPGEVSIVYGLINSHHGLQPIGRGQTSEVAQGEAAGGFKLSLDPATRGSLRLLRHGAEQHTWSGDRYTIQRRHAVSQSYVVPTSPEASLTTWLDESGWQSSPPVIFDAPHDSLRLNWFGITEASSRLPSTFIVVGPKATRFAFREIRAQQSEAQIPHEQLDASLHLVAARLGLLAGSRELQRQGA